MGLGTEKQDTKSFESAQGQLALIAGQQPNVRRARKSIASFKVREGMPVGVSVTLRRARMWEFLDRLTSIAVPRIRDFRGLNPRSFDGRGNYSMGVKEQLIFPEIDYDSVDVVRGLDVTITTSAKTDLEAFELLLGLGMPFAQEGRPGQAEREAREAEEEEERRKEEARLKAEEEQAALEQLKEENPEAYAKPEVDEGDEAAEGGNDEADDAAEESSENG
jgi:large subunit ribosomal protein L5